MTGLPFPDLRKKAEEFLELAGLTVWERAALLYLILSGLSSPVQIAAGGEIPRNKVYEVLEGLEKRALIYQASGAGGRNLYQSARPEEIFELLVKDAYRMMELRTDIQGRLVELYEGALATEGNLPVEAFASVTSSRTAVNSMLLGAFKACHDEVFLSGSDFAWIIQAPMLIGQLASRRKEGVAVKALIHAEPSVMEPDPEKELRARDFLVRRTNSVQSSAVIIDRKDVYVTIVKKTRKATDAPEVFVRLSSPEFAEDMIRLFDEAWEGGVDES